MNSHAAEAHNRLERCRTMVLERNNLADGRTTVGDSPGTGRIAGAAGSPEPESRSWEDIGRKDLT